MVNRIEIIEKWMEDNRYTKRKLSQDTGTPLSTICTAMNPKYENNETRFSKFWNACCQLTGIKELEVMPKSNRESAQPLDRKVIPEALQKCLITHGKTVIDKRVFKKYGEQKILEYFAEKGMKCKITIEQDELLEPYHYLELIK